MRTFELIGRFILDIVFSVVGFSLVAAAAWVLGVVVNWLKSGLTPQIIVNVIGYLEFGVFAVDVVGFSFLVLMSFVKFVLEVWRLYK